MNLKEMSTSVLMHLENDIRRELSYRKYHEGYKQGQFNASMDSVAKITPVSPQQQRDAIVERAKTDVVELAREQRPNLLDSQFVVNSDKKTVVCILRRFDLGFIEAKGIAKCAPSDCFNGHIGKAIALRRALGLEVHSEYLSAPQPTEVRVGDKIFLNFNGEKETVKGFNPGGFALTNESPGCVEPEDYRIIDDTRGVDGK